ncbi:MAG: hypothetical protein IPM06_19655 [Rhizobiales bacterium]|nr:hypothetical protein [Hyphomicrobiales bacterium]
MIIAIRREVIYGVFALWILVPRRDLIQQGATSAVNANRPVSLPVAQKRPGMLDRRHTLGPLALHNVLGRQPVARGMSAQAIRSRRVGASWLTTASSGTGHPLASQRSLMSIPVRSST